MISMTDAHRATWILVGVMLASACAKMAFAADAPQSPPDMTRGKAIAERWCVSCHVIASDSNATVPAGVPTFRAIANRKGQTADNIRHVLMMPHVPMPDMQLTRGEMDDLIAYIDSLRDAKSGPALLPKPQKGDQKPAIPHNT
ncbi:Cytochrome c [Filomicrobium insigne]|uniref:Cytochrome c n=2 Tax=Hyphomicrobiaceae TaxID=45401 RepID=A0A1H0H5B5_9HYPH|nr:Cytochrome c [Filomicrobium insigne]